MRRKAPLNPITESVGAGVGASVHDRDGERRWAGGVLVTRRQVEQREVRFLRALHRTIENVALRIARRKLGQGRPLGVVGGELDQGRGHRLSIGARRQAGAVVATEKGTLDPDQLLELAAVKKDAVALRALLDRHPVARVGAHRRLALGAGEVGHEVEVTDRVAAAGPLIRVRAG